MLKNIITVTLLTASVSASAMTVEMVDLNTKKAIGTINVEQSEYGVVFTPKLNSLPIGAHGFHVHTNGSCDPLVKDGKTVLGAAAGGHLDPEKTGKHGYPWTNDNHLGDLPPLYVNVDGSVTQPVLAPRLTLKDLEGRSLMIHAGGDNHSDHPAPLGGGGSRMVCGVIK